MKTGFSYKRVSSLEQKAKENSIPEQQRRINKFAKENEINIIREFEDSTSAFHDNNRSDFDVMIETAIKEKPNCIIFDDSSRFARTRKVAIDIKERLRAHGIEILYASEPNIDSNTVAGLWLEGIQEIKNEATSKEISFHTKKGMAGNLQHRDNETNWCYKNGGKPPYGYKSVSLYKGVGPKGKHIYKTIWNLDENTYPIARKIIVDLYTKKEMSYIKIRDFLNNEKIKGPNGDFWNTSTIKTMLNEHRLEQYSGTAIWNKENKKLIGVKYNPRDKWVICENAHPAIITKEELQEALERKNRTKNRNAKYKSGSSYLLSGLNMENTYLFTCSKCGGHVIGVTTSKSKIKKYACSTYNHKGACACINNWKINKEWIESRIIEIVRKNYFTNKKVEKNIETLYKELSNMKTKCSNEIKNIDKKIHETDRQIQNLLNSIKSGIAPELIVNEINNLKVDKDNLELEKNSILKNIDNQPKIRRQDIEEYYYNFQKLFNSSNIEEKKELIKTFVKNIILNYEEKQIEIVLYPIEGAQYMQQARFALR